MGCQPPIRVPGVRVPGASHLFGGYDLPVPPWEPRYGFTPALVRALLAIEAARTAVELTPIPAVLHETLRRQARLRSTHYSTRIEGNRLTLAEAEQVLAGETRRFLGRERDVTEVRHYWDALLLAEGWAERRLPLAQERIRHLHGVVERGPRARPTPYREGQNVIREAESGAIVYLPPEAADVPDLMGGLVDWVERSFAAEVPVPVIAGLAHYQFVTIHPFYDGNGRTARLLATYLLHRGGHALQGIYSLEEHHARDLAAYYNSLAAHPHHNYYEGRATADLTPWLTYFLNTLAGVFEAARAEAERAAATREQTEPELFRRLDPRARVVLGLLPSRRGRTYALSAIYRQLIGK